MQTKRCLVCQKILGDIRSTLCKSHSKTGSLNPIWKGNAVKYHGLHSWVKRYLPKTKFCQVCEIKPSLDLANISQEYRRDLSDWEWLCRKCHMTKDGRMNHLKQFASTTG